MKFGIFPPVVSGVCADPDWMSSFAVRAEGCGFESIVVVEHTIVVSGTSSSYPYSRSGRMPLADDCPIPDPLDLLAFLGAKTERIGLATGVLDNLQPSSRRPCQACRDARRPDARQGPTLRRRRVDAGGDRGVRVGLRQSGPPRRRVDRRDARALGRQRC